MSDVTQETSQQSFVSFFLAAGSDSVAHAVKKSFLAAIWFVFLTFPIMVIKVNTIEKTVDWHWENMGYIAVSVFFGSFLWRWLLARKELKKDESKEETRVESLLTRIQSNSILKFISLGALALAAVLYPQVRSEERRVGKECRIGGRHRWSP